MKTWIEFAISPVSLVAWCLLLLTALTYLTSRSRLLRGAASGLTLLYFLLSMPLTANLALGHLEEIARKAQTCGPPPAGSLIIVLAGGIYGHPSSPTAFSDLQPESLDRILKATMIALRVPDSRLLISGGAGGRHREADIMGALATQMGFPSGRIILDRTSRTTYQSARNVARILAGMPRTPRYLLSSAYHMPRALMAFERSGVRVCALPMDDRAIQAPAYDLLTPQLSAMSKMTRALHEYVGILFYRWVKFQ